MLKELKFVQGAVAKKDLIPTLTHFKIENGTVRSFNGTLALCSPIALDIDCTPLAIPFVKAIQNCKETVHLSMTPAGRLAVKSGSFKAFINCDPAEETPHVEPEGDKVEVDGESILKGLKIVFPFIGNDASRPWTNGCLFFNGSIFATNNIIVFEQWIGTVLPEMCNLPRSAIQEIIRVNEPPTHIQMNDKSITFHYEDGRWIRSALLETAWPDVKGLLERNEPCNPQPIDVKLFEALEIVKPFVDKMGRIIFNGKGIATDFEEAEGAQFDIEGFTHEGIYQIEMLNKLKDVTDTIDFSEYPNPCRFFGDNCRGIIVGLRI